MQGFTDAEPFSRYGVKATSILGLMPDAFPMLWHIESDTPDNIDFECMQDVMEMAIKAVELRENQINQNLGSILDDLDHADVLGKLF